MRTGLVYLVLLVCLPLAAADQVVLLNKYHDVPNARLIYSYMLIPANPYAVGLGSTLRMLVGVPVVSVGSANYWHTITCSPYGAGTEVVWAMTKLPPRPRGFYTTFDLVVSDEGVQDEEMGWWTDIGGVPDSGSVIGPAPAFSQRAKGSIEGYVFFDADQDGVYDDDELPIGGATVGLYDTQSNLVSTATTTADGHYRFDDLDAGTKWVVSPVSVTGNPANDGYVVWTTPVPSAVQEIKKDTVNRVDFGVWLDLEKIRNDAWNGVICGNNRSPGYWEHQVATTLGMQSGKPREDVYYILGRVEDLWFHDPFQFSPDVAGTEGPVDEQGLREAYLILANGGGDMLAKTLRQLLAAEMNWTSGKGSSLGALEGIIYWYAEWLINYPGVTNGQLETIKDVLDALNNLS
jgi:hypothetical protein